MTGAAPVGIGAEGGRALPSCGPLFPSLILAAGTFAVYLPTIRYPFISFDDPAYVTENPMVRAGLTWEGFRKAFTTFQISNWHPLTWLSHMADVELFGLWPGGHHLTSVAIHAINSVLLFLLLRRLTGSDGRSAFVAALFAWHPLHVESVAWVSERKDLLAGMFWILATGAYLRYVRRPGLFRYAGLLALFTLGLMSKPMVLTLPFVLLLLDYWPLGRTATVPHRVLVMEKAPLLALSLVSAAVTYAAQHAGDSVVRLGDNPLWYRILNALSSYGAYIRKTVWPADLAVFYPHPGVGGTLSLGKAALGALLLAGFTVLAYRSRRRSPAVLVGWFWFLGTLVPVIGIVQVGAQAMADRYTYLPMIGLSIAAAWGVPDRVPARRHRDAALGAVAMGACLLLGVLAFVQVRYWQSSMRLFSRALEVTRNNWMAHDAVGSELLKRGDAEGAISHLREAVRLNPLLAGARANLGWALYEKGEKESGLFHALKAVELEPAGAPGRNVLGYLLAREGDLGAAEEQFRFAIRVNPLYADAFSNRGVVLAERGAFLDAAESFRRALEIDPEHPQARFNRGLALLKAGRNTEASAVFRDLLGRNPRHADAHYYLGKSLVAQGSSREAGRHFREALALRPGDAGFLEGLDSLPEEETR